MTVGILALLSPDQLDHKWEQGNIIKRIDY